MRWLDGITDSRDIHKFGQTPEDSEGQESLVYFSPGNLKESDAT